MMRNLIDIIDTGYGVDIDAYQNSFYLEYLKHNHPKLLEDIYDASGFNEFIERWTPDTISSPIIGDNYFAISYFFIPIGSWMSISYTDSAYELIEINQQNIIFAENKKFPNDQYIRNMNEGLKITMIFENPTIFDQVLVETRLEFSNLTVLRMIAV